MSILRQHSEAAFREYEPYIAQVLQNYPAPTTFPPKSPNTFIARFRDALNGMRLNGWQSKDFTIEAASAVFRLLKSGGDFILTQDPEGGIYCGPPIREGMSVQFSRGTVIQGIEEHELDARDQDAFKAVAVLKSRGLLNQPLIFRNVSDAQLSLMSQQFESIEFFEDEPGQYIMI